MTLKLDHLVFAARTLEEGAAYLKDQLGVDIPPGGEHLQMGTHNCLMSLGDSVYFELIAIAPHLAAPDRPRWFGLDDPETQARISEQPQLLTWVVQTDDLEAVSAGSPIPLGAAVDMYRGDFTWRLTIREDGSLPMGGLMPSIIEWGKGVTHPSRNLPDLGVGLERLVCQTPTPEVLMAALESVGVENLLTVEKGEKVNFAATVLTHKGRFEI